MNLAYVITAHKNARQFRRLLNVIYEPSNTYVTHVDRKAPGDVHKVAQTFSNEHSNVHAIPGESIIWGSWNLARAQIRAMAEALRASRDWQYCLNLTAQDYPLRSQQEISHALSTAPTDANYLEVLEFANASPGPRKRLEYFWFPWRGKLRKGPRRRPPKFEVFWGSNYFAFTRAACEHLVASKISRQMQNYFRWSLCSDELIFQNVLMHSPLRDTMISKIHHQLVWAGGSHPKTFTIADRDELLASDAWFARKFDDTVDAKILDLLDEHLKELK